ncbi:MAG: o-succinylbenzoate synthase [Actinomycetota bacterium]
MRVEAAELHRVRLPLHRPLRSAHGVEHERRVLLLRLRTDVGDGWGECSALAAPTYLADHLDGEQHLLATQLLPRLLTVDDVEVESLDHVLGLVGHPTSRAAVVAALLDARLRAAGRSLADQLGVEATAVPVGVVIGIDDVEAVVARAVTAAESGVGRIKVKIRPGHDLEPLQAVREAVGEDVELHADANGAYLPDDLGLLQLLDGLGLGLIEQPYPADRLVDSATLQRELVTPISLDEAIDSPARAVDALELGACRSVSCKAPRLGGIDRAVAVHDVCLDRGAGAWAGGMYESGVGRHVVLALAGLPGMTEIGDVGPTSSYLAADVVEQQDVDEGTVRVHDAPGISPVPDPVQLDELGEAVTEFTR